MSTLVSICCVLPTCAKRRDATSAPHTLCAGKSGAAFNWGLLIGSFFSRRQVELPVGEPTRITELSVPKSSELFIASGSATQREPLIIKAYSWRPGERGTATDHTPGAPERWSLLAPLVHSLKSPMISTLRAWASTKTNRMTLTVSVVIEFSAIVGAGFPAPVREPIASVETTANAEIPAARANAPSGERCSRALRHQTIDPSEAAG